MEVNCTKDPVSPFRLRCGTAVSPDRDGKGREGFRVLDGGRPHTSFDAVALANRAIARPSQGARSPSPSVDTEQTPTADVEAPRYRNETEPQARGIRLKQIFPFFVPFGPERQVRETFSHDCQQIVA